MLTLLMVELIVLATLLPLLFYFYNEAQWQKWTADVLAKPPELRNTALKLPAPSSYKPGAVSHQQF